eukprot:g4722.t1
MDFTVSSIHRYKRKWKHGKRKARLPLEVFVVTRKDDKVDVKELSINNFEFDKMPTQSMIKTLCMEGDLPNAAIKINDFGFKNEKRNYVNFSNNNSNVAKEEDRRAEQKEAFLLKRIFTTVSPRKNSYDTSNMNLLIVSPSETICNTSNENSMQSPELSIYDLPSPPINKHPIVTKSTTSFPVPPMPVVQRNEELFSVKKGVTHQTQHLVNAQIKETVLLNNNISLVETMKSKRIMDGKDKKGDEVNIKPTISLKASLFQTGSGRSVKISDLETAVKLLSSDGSSVSQSRVSKLTIMHNNAYICTKSKLKTTSASTTMSNYLKPPSSVAPTSSKQRNNDDKVSSASLFQTGSGRRVNISKDSLNAASKLLQSEVSSIRKKSKSNFVTPRPMTKTNNDDKVSSASLFQTGSGRRVNISKDSLNAASKLLQSEVSSIRKKSKSNFVTPRPMTKTNNDDKVSSASLFQTGSGRRVNISKDSLNAASKLLQSDVCSGDGVKRNPSSFTTPTLIKETSIARRPINAVISSVMKKNGGKRTGFVNPRMRSKIRSEIYCSNNKVKGKTGLTKRKYFKQQSNGESFIRKKKRKYNKQLRDFAVEENRLSALNTSITNITVYQKAMSVTSKNAVNFSFQSDFGDELTWKNFRNKLLESDDIEEKYLTETWVANHYRWIIWKLSAMERKFPHVCKGNFLNPKNVLDQLKHRYNREVLEGKRSALKMILEGDSPPNRFMVLMISQIDYNDSKYDKNVVDNMKNDGTSSKKCVEKHKRNCTCCVELSDGWYCIKTMFDDKMLELIRKKALKSGAKLVVQQSSLVNWNSGVNPLDCTCNNVHDFSSGNTDPKLCISKNSSRIAAWDAKLGFQPSNFFYMDMSTFDSSGGVIGCVEVFIERVYPMVYVERSSNGTTIFRSEKGESEAQESFERTVSSNHNFVNNTDNVHIDSKQQKIDTKNFNQSQQWRNVNPIFQVDVIDARSDVRVKGSIIFWTASEDFRSQLMTNCHWRLFALTPSNHNHNKSIKNGCSVYSYSKRSQCYVLPDVSEQAMLKCGYVSRRRILIGEIKHLKVQDLNEQRIVVDIVAAMVGECFQLDRRFLFFVDESGSILSVLLNKSFHKDVPKFRQGSACILLNLSVYAYDKQNGVLQSEWKESSTSSMNSCNSDYRLKLNAHCKQLRKWTISVEGKITLAHFIHTSVPTLIGSNCVDGDTIKHVINSNRITLCKVGFIVGYKYLPTNDNDGHEIEDEKRLMIVDFQDGHGLQINIKTRKKLIPYHKYLASFRKENVWYKLPMQFHQISLRPFICNINGCNGSLAKDEKKAGGSIYSDRCFFFTIVPNRSRFLEFNYT